MPRVAHKVTCMTVRKVGKTMFGDCIAYPIWTDGHGAPLTKAEYMVAFDPPAKIPFKVLASKGPSTHVPIRIPGRPHALPARDRSDGYNPGSNWGWRGMQDQTILCTLDPSFTVDR